jgi:hypothetical protein
MLTHLLRSMKVICETVEKRHSSLYDVSMSRAKRAQYTLRAKKLNVLECTQVHIKDTSITPTTTHDPRPTTHDPRPTTHDPRPTTQHKIVVHSHSQWPPGVRYSGQTSGLLQLPAKIAQNWVYVYTGIHEIRAEIAEYSLYIPTRATGLGARSIT